LSSIESESRVRVETRNSSKVRTLIQWSCIFSDIVMKTSYRLKHNETSTRKKIKCEITLLQPCTIGLVLSVTLLNLILTLVSFKMEPSPQYVVQCANVLRLLRQNMLHLTYYTSMMQNYLLYTTTTEFQSRSATLESSHVLLINNGGLRCLLSFIRPSTCV
jgi:hypothetical protein